LPEYNSLFAAPCHGVAKHLLLSSYIGGLSFSPSSPHSSLPSGRLPEGHLRFRYTPAQTQVSSFRPPREPAHKNSYFKSMNAIVSEKGQVTIPKPIRDDLGLEAGSILEFTEDHGRIIVTKILQDNPISAWRGKGVLPSGRSVNEYLDIVRGA